MTGATLSLQTDMERIYDICGMRVQCDFRESTMLSRAEKYLSEGQPDMVLPHSDRMYAALRESNPQLSTDECEVIASAHSFYSLLLKYGGFMLHSSAVEMDGRAYLFSAPSGTGKSTHTSLWLERFGQRARIINDDKPALCIKDGRVFAYGTPWSGKSDLNINVGVPVQGICILERSEENHICRCDESEALFALLDQTIRPPFPNAMSRLLELVDKVLSQTPVWRMGCNISPEAAQMAYDTMGDRELLQQTADAP